MHGLYVKPVDYTIPSQYRGCNLVYTVCAVLIMVAARKLPPRGTLPVSVYGLLTIAFFVQKNFFEKTWKNLLTMGLHPCYTANVERNNDPTEHKAKGG